jgi:hypothetical protein
MTRTCKCCGWELDIEQFGFDTKHGKRYRRHTCGECRSADSAKRERAKKYQAFHRLVSWPVPGMLA